MKSNTDKYEKVDKLPKGALSVKEFCEGQNYTTSNFYMRLKKGSLPQWKIVVFQGFNFVTSNNN